MTSLLRSGVLMVLALLVLSACSTMSVGTAVRLRALNLLEDDIAGLVLALDVPVALVPQPGLSRFELSAVKSDGTTISAAAALVRTDAQELAQNLPPPAQDRGYYLFAFAESDKQELRDAQAEIRSARQNDGAGNPTVALNLSFCVLAEIDPDRTYFSAHIALPGAGALEPLISQETIASLVAHTGQAELSPCGNFSN